jgi:small subunit ribosomal protein S16
LRRVGWCIAPPEPSTIEHRETIEMEGPHMVKIRLTRVGAKKKPFYRIQAIDERKQRDGRALEYLGTYDPNQDPAVVNLKNEAIDAWIAKGAQMSDTVASLVKRAREQASAS